MFNLTTFSILALGPISSILAIPTPESLASAPATKILEAREGGMPSDVVQGTIGLKDDGALVNGWNAANNWTGPASLDVDFCECDNSGPAFEWFITITNDKKYDSGGCGAGFLDNFRGHCGVISNWGCQYVGADHSTAALFFATQVGCTLSDASDVIAAASNNGIPHMQCGYASSEGGDTGRDMPPVGDGSDDPAAGAGDIPPPEADP